MVTKKEWLESLGVGDEVVINRPRSWGTDKQAIRGITGITKTQIVVGEKRFIRADGWQRGRDHGRDFISKPTPEVRAKILRELNLAIIDRFISKSRDKLSDDEILSIVSVLRGAMERGLKEDGAL